jgi:hypothetical protein
MGWCTANVCLQPKAEMADLVVSQFTASRRAILQTGALLTASAWLAPACAQNGNAEVLFRNGTIHVSPMTIELF